jgi:hypothetical protein
MTSELTKLNRFTTFPFLLDIIVRQKLTLLNPDFWEDYNDRKTIQFYKKKTNAKSIYALCLTFKSETIHHWNAFANGPSGCCIEFSHSKLTKILDRLQIKYGKVTYMKIADLTGGTPIGGDLLPFVKRTPFRPENEYRIIATSDKEQLPAIEIPISLDIINRITLSNKLPKVTFNSLKQTIVGLEPALKDKITRSSLYENNTWIEYFSKI